MKLRRSVAAAGVADVFAGAGGEARVDVRDFDAGHEQGGELLDVGDAPIVVPGERLICAVAPVGLVIVSNSTVMPAPRLSVVTSCCQWVPVPVNWTVRLSP